jgi:hypothetical protein
MEGPINWPPVSSDLTPMDFLFWGYIKDTEYSKRLESLPDFKRTAAAITVVPMDVLCWMWGEAKFCFDVCRAINNYHTELH